MKQVTKLYMKRKKTILGITTTTKQQVTLSGDWQTVNGGLYFDCILEIAQAFKYPELPPKKKVFTVAEKNIIVRDYYYNSCKEQG